MAEEEATAAESPATQSETSPPARQFLEVVCRSSGKVRKFAKGTKAGFALHIINKKLEYGSQPGLFIEAVKKGEEPVSFGQDAVLVDYGEGWKLQTVVESDGTKKGGVPLGAHESGSSKNLSSGQALNAQYMGRIFLAFVFLFLLGAVFTIALENLPKLIVYMNSSSQADAI